MGTAIEIFRVVSRRKWVVLVTTLVTSAVIGVGTFLTPPTYSASSIVRVALAPSGSISYEDYMYSQRLMNTTLEILRSRPMLEEVLQRLGLSMTPYDLARKVKVELLPDTELIRVTVEDSNPWRARDIASTLAALVVEQGPSLYSGGARSTREILEERLKAIESTLEQDRANLRSAENRTGTTAEEIDALESKIWFDEQTHATLLAQHEQALVAEEIRARNITVVEPAIEPTEPSGPSKKLSIMLAALLGLAGGTGLAFLFENLDIGLSLQRLSSLGRGGPGEEAEEERERVPVSMEELGLPVSVTAILNGAGIGSAEDLWKKDDEELLAIRGLGAKSLEMVRASLRAKGLVKE